MEALYDHEPVMDEHMDLRAGDIIAVSSTPPNGWWSGELVEKERRVAGKTVFPSMSVALCAEHDA